MTLNCDEKERKPLLQDKVCCVTGASRGIGKAIAYCLASEGATVYAVSRSSVEEPYTYGNGYIVPVSLDIRDAAGMKALLMRIKKEAGKLDVLVNNAAIEKNERIGMITSQSIQEMFETNVFAMIEVIQIASRLMQRNGGGSIINIASKVGERGNAGQLVYSATKGAVIALTKSAAKELASMKIRVNAIAPGLTNTEMIKTTDPAFLERRIANICMGRLAEPADIANAVLFFASDLSGYVSGQVLDVDGCTVM